MGWDNLIGRGTTINSIRGVQQINQFGGGGSN